MRQVLCLFVIIARKYGALKIFNAAKIFKTDRAMRYYLGVHKYAPIAGMQGDLGWLATKFRRYICMVIFWNRIMKLDNSKLVKHIF